MELCKYLWTIGRIGGGKMYLDTCDLGIGVILVESVFWLSNLTIAPRHSLAFWIFGLPVKFSFLEQNGADLYIC
jgi:hypothetical protein